MCNVAFFFYRVSLFLLFLFSSEIVSKSLESLAEQSLAAKFLQNPSMQLHLQVHDFPKLSPKWISFWWLTHISRRTLQTRTTNGKWSLFHRNPNIFGLGRQFEPINFGAPILVQWVPCPCFSLITWNFGRTKFSCKIFSKPTDVTAPTSARFPKIIA